MRLCLVALLITSSSAAAAPNRSAERPLVTALVRGGSAVAPLREALARVRDLPVQLQLAEMPSADSRADPPASVARPDEDIALARKAYIAADFLRCQELLGEEGLVPALLGEGRRTLAARILFWRIACAFGALKRADAERFARQLAVLGLESPPDADRVTPEVEALLSRVARQVAKERLIPLRVSSTKAATVFVDGRTDGCPTPCTLDVYAGDHVVTVSGDGITPESRVFRVGADHRELRLDPVAAAPELAAKQWMRRFADAPNVDSEASVRLLSLALRTRRLILVTAEGEGPTVRMRGVLATDGRVMAHSERTTRSRQEIASAGQAVVRDLLVLGKVIEAPPLTRRAAFWVPLGVAVAAAAVAATLAATLYQPPTRFVVDVGGSP